MEVQKYRVFQTRLIAIDDGSMFNKDCHTVVVTHADYRALEDENRSLRASFDEANKLYRYAREELASLRARVGDLPDARPESEDINEDPLASGYDAGWNRYREAALVALGEVK